MKKYAYTEIRKTSRSDLRDLCIRYHWFTCGDNDEYEELMKYADKDNITTDDLVEMATLIYSHSSEESRLAIDSLMFLINKEACSIIFLED